MDKLLLQDLKSNIFRGLKLIRMLNFDSKATVGPIRVDIAPTSACTYNCCFCNSHSYLRDDHAEPVFMHEDVLHNIFSDLKELGTKELLFSGNGEPLLSKALRQEIKQKGKNFSIEILSNGSTLDFVDEELFSNLRFLTISLNSGNGKSHQITHGYKGENQFEKTIENIERILNFSNANNKIKLNYVITTDNYGELEDFFGRAMNWNVNFMARPVSVDFPELAPKGLNHELLDAINATITRYLADRTLSGKLNLSFQLLRRACQTGYRKIESQNTLYPCYMGFIQEYIEANGDVLLCSTGSEKPLGNLNENNLKTIWQHKDNLDTRMMATHMHETDDPVFSGCYNCTNVQCHSVAFHNIYSRIPGLYKQKGQ